MPVSSPCAPAAGWSVTAAMPLISMSCCSRLQSSSRVPCATASGASGWSLAKPNRRAAHSLILGLNFMVHEPSGIEARVDVVVEVREVDEVADDLGLVELGQGGRHGPALRGRDAVEGVGRRVRDLAAAAPRTRQLHERRLEHGTDRRPRPEVWPGLHLDPRRAHRTASTIAAPAPISRRSASAKRPISSLVVTSVAQTSSAFGKSGVVGIPAHQRQAGQHAPLEERRVHPRGVGNGDRELVEVGRAVDTRRADLGQGAFQLAGASGAAGRHVAQPVGTERGQVDRRRQGAERLVGADVAGRLLAADVLLARPQRHHERPSAIEVGRLADQPAGDLSDQRLGRGQDAEVGAAVLRGDAEGLALAGRDVGAVFAGRRQDGQRDRLDDGHEERSGGMRQPPDLGHRLEDAEGVGLAGQHGGDRGPVVERTFQGGQVGRAVVERGQLLEVEAGRAEVGAGGVEVVAMDGAAGQHALTTGGPDGHQRRFRGRGRAVVVRGRDDIEAGQLGDERLVLVDRSAACPG